jgi:hypothetical protein
MFTLIAFGTVLFLLTAAVGRPYPQSWYQRWGNYDR